MPEEGYSTASDTSNSVQGPVQGTEDSPQENAANPQVPKKPVPWRAYLAAAKNNRTRILENSWRINVDYRVQRPFSGVGDNDQTQDRVSVPEDWSRTKQKTAQLAFQV